MTEGSMVVVLIVVVISIWIALKVIPPQNSAPVSTSPSRPSANQYAIDKALIDSYLARAADHMATMPDGQSELRSLKTAYSWDTMSRLSETQYMVEMGRLRNFVESMDIRADKLSRDIEEYKRRQQ